MKIEKCLNGLSVDSKLNFGEDNHLFCGIPYVHLIAFKDSNKFWESNTIGISVHDGDDLDLGLIYQTDSDHFFVVLHELINWMHDHEQGINCIDKIWDIFSFFPDLGCGRKIW